MGYCSNAIHLKNRKMVISIWSHVRMIECPLKKWGEGGLKLKNGFWGLTLEGWRDQILSRGRGEGAIALECLIGVLPPLKLFRPFSTQDILISTPQPVPVNNWGKFLTLTNFLAHYTYADFFCNLAKGNILFCFVSWYKDAKLLPITYLISHK